MTPKQLVHPLEPVFDRRSRVLILGSFPSPKSRETGFYYGNPQNRFWRVMADLFGCETPGDNAQKRALLLERRLALWDVVRSCLITGAADASIRSVEYNRLDRVFSAAPIALVALNGGTAGRLYRQAVGESGPPRIILPSTSPANARFSLEQLTAQWSAVLPALKE